MTIKIYNYKQEYKLEWIYNWKNLLSYKVKNIYGDGPLVTLIVRQESMESRYIIYHYCNYYTHLAPCL